MKMNLSFRGEQHEPGRARLANVLATDRILILGAGGWFGSTMLDLCHQFDSSAILAIGARNRIHRVRDRVWQIHEFSRDLVENFSPTVVANFAYVTPQAAGIMKSSEIREINGCLTEAYLWSSQLEQVRLSLTVSSGAASSEASSEYGSGKLREELMVSKLSSAERSVVILRAYSVSGPFVRQPMSFALSNFVLQARTGRISVEASRPTFRRYVSCRDLLRVGMAVAVNREFTMIESGGQLVELGELAELVLRVVNPSATIDRPPLVSLEPLIYASVSETWDDACRSLNFVPMSLEEQIAEVAASLPAYGSG